MATVVSGTCLVQKVSGMIYINEEVTPSVLEWKAIDQLKVVTIPLNALRRLQAPKETLPKMMLRILYQGKTDPEERDLKVSFTNRPTMNNIKESLQTIIARQKTIIKDLPTPQASGSATPDPGSTDLSQLGSLSDEALLKNHQLQQKLLLEDKNLRNIFTQSVIKYKLSPTVFWLSRLHLLRTFALTVSQHRGPYNVLLTIKPVATSDNQVNVNVTRDTITEIFETYPIIKRAYHELVPVKFDEGEFWLRFFNSKLFRRLRGDKINTSNTRGDVVLDKYLYVGDQTDTSEPEVSKFLDLAGNEEDNPQKLGNKPDVTMRFHGDNVKFSHDTRLDSVVPTVGENEMTILMRNMNKLSSKIVSLNTILHEAPVKKKRPDDLSVNEAIEYEQELNLHDLNEIEEMKYIQLNINKDISYDRGNDDVSSTKQEAVDPDKLRAYLRASVFLPGQNNLNETFEGRDADISKAAADVIAITKANFRAQRLFNVTDVSSGDNVLTESIYQELITFNITIMEFLLHFWKIFLNSNNPVQLKKIFTSLKNCKNSLNELVGNIQSIFNKHEVISKNEKLKEKLNKDLSYCVLPLQSGLDKALTEYVKAVRAAADEPNANGKRPLEE